LREYHRNRYQKNKATELARCSEKRVVRNLSRNATLSKKHKEEIKNFYWLAKDLELISGQKYHVDHIIPLQGDNVCGLHVPWNLQVLPADINLSKGNRYDILA
jgi:5-methylcytosine-specific restriction endonuclease McrA